MWIIVVQQNNVSFLEEAMYFSFLSQQSRQTKNKTTTNKQLKSIINPVNKERSANFGEKKSGFFDPIKLFAHSR